MGSRPRVLYITNALPHPPHSGGQLREYSILSRLAPHHDIHLVAFSSCWDEESTRLERQLEFASSVTLVEVRPREDQRGSVGDRVWATSTPQGQDVVRGLVNKLLPAVIHVEGYFLMQHVDARIETPIVLVNENIEHVLEAASEAFGASGVSTSRLARGEEISAWRRSRITVAVTPEDAAVIRREAPDLDTRCITNGFDHIHTLRAHGARGGSRRSAIYFANYTWHPSRDAALTLIKDVWPRVLAILPDARLTLAGRGMDAEIISEARFHSSIAIVGEYEDLTTVAAEAQAMVYPLRYGGGIKVKVVEALSIGLPVVTTPIALQGFPEQARQAVLVGETPQAVATLLCALLEADKTLAALSARGIQAIRELPTWAESATALSDAWRAAAHGSPQPSPVVEQVQA